MTQYVPVVPPIAVMIEEPATGCKLLQPRPVGNGQYAAVRMCPGHPDEHVTIPLELDENGKPRVPLK
jgi:hypothetical protein